MAEVQAIPAGERAANMQAGDFILTHENHWTSRTIRFGQRFAWRGDKKKYASWNHAALILNPEGDLAEALGHGVVQTNISGYDEKAYYIVRINASEEDQKQILAFA